MRFVSDEEEYYFILKEKRDRGEELTEHQKQYIMDYAALRVRKLIEEDPDLLAVFKRLADK